MSRPTVMDAAREAPMKLHWLRKLGKGTVPTYWIAETTAGRVRVSRINKTGVALFRAYFPDGKQFTASTVDEAKSYSEQYMDRTK